MDHPESTEDFQRRLG